MDYSNEYLNYVFEVVKQLMSDTDSRNIVWNCIYSYELKNDGRALSWKLFKRPVIGKAEDCPENYYFDWEPYIYGDKYEYKSLFNTCVDSDLTGDCYSGYSEAGLHYYLVNCSQIGVEGWELYIDSGVLSEGDSIKGVYTTLTNDADKLLPITRDLIECIKRNCEDATKVFEEE